MTEMENGERLGKRLRRCWRFSVLVLIAVLYMVTVAKFYALNSTRTLVMALPKPSAPVQRALEEAVIASTSPPPTKAPLRIQHPYYLQECYAYEDLRARFTCNDTDSFRNYSYENILECASSLWEIIRDKSVPDPWGKPGSLPSPPPPPATDAVAVSKRPSVHLVMAGDSHIRNIFEVFLRRIAGPRVKYRVAKMGPNEWKASEDLFATWKSDAHEFFHELILLDGPLRITFYWDPFLETLPQLLSSWTAGNGSKPTHLLIGSTLHYMQRTRSIFMKQGPKVASVQFSSHLKTISPQLEKFSNTTPVVFKLQDHLQKDPRNNVENPQNIDYYNQIASDLLPDSPFVVWNSTVPLSDLYSEVCLRKGSVLPRTVDWRCDDVKHLGYIIIDQYLDMYLNDICCCFGKGGITMT
ncbi:uncharacterized protein [Macrobrachium rosenbergii]|uniref:uncharacterized protein n=1 Tax=Macrobrachium rosenbergii TaxID=79674 RepID=UPI0034D58B5A